MDWRVGCSGYSYKEWKELFYPPGLPQKEWFSYYCQFYKSIEINASFYKLPSIKSLNRWYEESSADFLFSMKAPRLITHYKQLVDCQTLVEEFCTLLQEGLKDKLGIVLMQFPPFFEFTFQRLDLLLDLAKNNVTFALEFRHASWWREDIFLAMKKEGMIFCGQSFPGNLPNDVIANNDTLYYRFHGVPVLYKSLYNDLQLSEVKNTIGQQAEIKRAFVFFNNTWGSAALKNSATFKSL